MLIPFQYFESLPFEEGREFFVNILEQAEEFSVNLVSNETKVFRTVLIIEVVNINCQNSPFIFLFDKRIVAFVEVLKIS